LPRRQVVKTRIELKEKFGEAKDKFLDIAKKAAHEIREMKDACASIQKVITEKPHSVEISVNAKGQYSGKVKVYAETIEKAMELSLLKAKELNIVISEANQ